MLVNETYKTEQIKSLRHFGSKSRLIRDLPGIVETGLKPVSTVYTILDKPE
jgi:hypothetical protein